MQSDEIDKIIEEALKKDGSKRHHRRPSQDRTKTVRKILNVIFLVGAAFTLFVFFMYPDNKMLFYCIGFGSILIKIVEYFIRFLL